MSDDEEAYWAERAERWAKAVAASPTHQICGHCDAPMAVVTTRTGERVLACARRCAKSAKPNVADRRLWRTREGRVMNIRHMEDGHLQRAIAYLEREHRTSGRGYQWLREEAQRRGLQPEPKFLPPERADYDVACASCGRVYEKPEVARAGTGMTVRDACSCGAHAWNRINEPETPRELADEGDVDEPPKRGIDLKGVPKP